MRESEIVKNNSFVEAIERLVSPIVGEMNTDNKFGKQQLRGDRSQQQEQSLLNRVVYAIQAQITSVHGGRNKNGIES